MRHETVSPSFEKDSAANGVAANEDLRASSAFFRAVWAHSSYILPVGIRRRCMIVNPCDRHALDDEFVATLSSMVLRQ